MRNLFRRHCLVLLPVVLLAAYGAWQALRAPEQHRTPAEGDPVAAFLAMHWADPLPPQGQPPAGFSALEQSLAPEACGACHAAQYAGWKNSQHSRAMGAGILWQLHVMSQQEANACLRCHAPLAEQKALLARELDWPKAPASPPPAHVPAGLGHQGLVCAACHVRGNERFGPPARELLPTAATSAHGGFKVSAAFEDSRFCATCHQFPESGPRTAGKLREDTYAQWQQTRYAAEGQTCQQCHMPDRQHLWHGIHSPDMVRRALGVTLELQREGSGRLVVAELRNIGAGHHFPTYMVPAVTATLLLLDGQGRVRQQLAQHVIGWQVSTDLEQELADTRLPAGEAVTLKAMLPDTMPGWRVELRVDVAPREHYERMFAGMAAQAGRLPPAARELLQQARKEAAATRFEAWRISRPL